MNHPNPEDMNAAITRFIMGNQHNPGPQARVNNIETLQEPYNKDSDDFAYLFSNADDEEDYDKNKDDYDNEQGDVNAIAAADHNTQDHYLDDFDSSVPLAYEEQLAERESIKEAMKNLEDINDEPQFNGKDAQAVQHIKDNYYPEYVFDMAARDIIVSTCLLYFVYTKFYANDFCSGELILHITELYYRPTQNQPAITSNRLLIDSNLSNTR